MLVIRNVANSLRANHSDIKNALCSMNTYIWTYLITLEYEMLLTVFLALLDFLSALPRSTAALAIASRLSARCSSDNVEEEVFPVLAMDFNESFQEVSFLTSFLVSAFSLILLLNLGYVDICNKQDLFTCS